MYLKWLTYVQWKKLICPSQWWFSGSALATQPLLADFKHVANNRLEIKIIIIWSLAGVEIRKTHLQMNMHT